MKNRKLINDLRSCAKNILATARELEAAGDAPSPSPLDIISAEVLSPAGGAHKQVLPLVLGRDDFGENLVVDLARLPHLLIGGASGQGKSSCLRSLMAGLVACRGPGEVRFIIHDPTSFEFLDAAGLRHMCGPVCNSPRDMMRAFVSLMREIGRRNRMLYATKCCNIAAFNKRKISEDNGFPEKLPYIVVFIDEIAGLMEAYGRRAFESRMVSLVRFARPVGVHFVLTTRRMEGIAAFTDKMKEYFRARLAFRTLDEQDSRAIIGEAGAERLLRSGDFMFRHYSYDVTYGQGAYVNDLSEMWGQKCGDRPSRGLRF